MNIPNALTVLRLLMVPCVPVLFAHKQPYWALFVFLFASFTDVLDGYLARRFNQVTVFGKVVDPFADKLMLLATIICLCVYGHIPVWIVVPVFIKEAIMLTVGVLVYFKGLVIPANIFGKVAAALFALAVVASFFAETIGPWHVLALAVATLVAYVALVQYAVILIKMLKNAKLEGQTAEKKDKSMVM